MQVYSITEMEHLGLCVGHATPDTHTCQVIHTETHLAITNIAQSAKKQNQEVIFTWITADLESSKRNLTVKNAVITQ